MTYTVSYHAATAVSFDFYYPEHTRFRLDNTLRYRHAHAVRCCGHEVTERECLKWEVTYDDPQIPESIKIEPGPFQAIAWVRCYIPDIPVSYPMCGDWGCPDSADWACVTSHEDGQTYAGAAEEQRILGQRLGGEPLPEWAARDLLQRRRDHQAAGRPLWTIDLRPEWFR